MPRDNRLSSSEDGAEDTVRPYGDFEDEFAGMTADDFSYAEEFSLESILAEYKGSAYIDGDKRTPAPVLQEKTDRIVKEVIGGDGRSRKNSAVASGNTTPLPRQHEQAGTLPKQPLQTAKATEESGTTQRLPKTGDIFKAQSDGFKKTIEKRNAAAKKADRDVISFDELKTAEGTSSFIAEVEKAISKQTQLEEETQKSVRKGAGLFNRYGDVQGWEDEEEDEEEALPEEPEPLIEEEIFEEPDFRLAAKRFADGCNTYSIRSFVSLVLSVVMAILTLVFQAGAKLPFGIGSNMILFNGILLIFLFIVMMLSLDKLILGFKSFFRKGPGLEALNLMSCIATAAAAAYNIAKQDAAAGIPFCVISAFSLTFTLWGEKIYYKALTETMKTAVSVAGPYGVVSEIIGDLDKTVIRKVSGRTAGFYNNLIQADIGETAYKLASPILMVAAVALGVYASISHGTTKHILHNIAAIMAAAAPFSAMMTFALPFSAVAKRARHSGAAIAGWGGADDIFHTDGASITDEDLFPPGTISLGGIKIFEEVSPDKAMRYTASLIVASNCGLTKLFSEHLSKQGMSLIRVEDFSCYEGGIGGNIRGEQVIAGSAAFMNLMGIRIPASLNVKNAIFTAVNKKLIAVFTINYVPVKTVQNALFSVLRYRVKLFFAMRDFSITPVMLEQKFKVPVDAVEYIPIQDSYDISDTTKNEAKRVSAILTREGLGPFAEAITGGRRLRSAALVSTVFSLISAGLGMLLMFIICWSGAYSSASAGNLMLYMLSMLVVVLLISGFARFRQ